MFKVNNKDTKTTPPCSSVSIVNFEQVNADWDIKHKIEFYDYSGPTLVKGVAKNNGLRGRLLGKGASLNRGLFCIVSTNAV